MTARFADRHDAGRRLAEKLADFRGRSDVIVLALPRGGVPVGLEVARALGCPMDVFLVRKVGLPGHEEFAMGAIASGGTVMINRDVMHTYGVSEQQVATSVERERAELARRDRAYRGNRPHPELRGRTVILVDDGLATGSSMRAAVAAVRRHDPRAVVVAVPVAPAETCRSLEADADQVVCALLPEPFYAVGLWYENFSQMSDEEVTEMLVSAGASTPADHVTSRTRDVQIEATGVTLAGDLTVPSTVRGLVIFAHGSGSSRHSRRNRDVAEALNGRSLATLLLDLLTREEEALDARAGHLRFDLALLAARLIGAADWARTQDDVSALPVGFFGASTGGGAALIAAADRPELVAAVVSRGGRPDLAGEALPRVRAPTLLLVGGRDDVVLELNEQARARMRAPVELTIIPGATHLFEEPGALDQVAQLAGNWFVRHLDTSSL